MVVMEEMLVMVGLVAQEDQRMVMEELAEVAELGAVLMEGLVAMAANLAARVMQVSR